MGTDKQEEREGGLSRVSPVGLSGEMMIPRESLCRTLIGRALGRPHGPHQS